MLLDESTHRAQEWEINSCYQVDSSNFTLRHSWDPCIPLSRRTVMKRSFPHPSSNSITTSVDRDLQKKRQSRFSYPSRLRHPSRSLSPTNEQDFVVNLDAVHKGICIRIVNTFLDGDQAAYTIWVLDIESGKEWYAPCRYYSDFLDLRSATACEATADLSFPLKKWGILSSIGKREFSADTQMKDTNLELLENFLRELCGLVYRGTLHPKVAEVAVHLQSFLGCDACFRSETNPTLTQIAVSESSYRNDFLSGRNKAQRESLLQLKRSLHLYVYRLFLLPVMERLVSQFIDEVKKGTPTLDKMQALEKKSSTALKDYVLINLEKLRIFLDQLQDLIFEGCENDMKSIAEQNEVETLSSDNSYCINKLQEAIREHIEIESYVPLRSVVSRQLVNGWRNDDMLMQFKFDELQKRPQSYFKIHPNHYSPSEWHSVSEILRIGVGRSTLPCVKLRAIVDAATTIPWLYSEEHFPSAPTHSPSDDYEEKKTVHGRRSKELLGADDFLPIFIFCIVRAKIERPCALCKCPNYLLSSFVIRHFFVASPIVGLPCFYFNVLTMTGILLRTLCHPSKRSGETGYYLASFEAAIEHIKEIDLAEYYNDFTFI